MFDLETEPKPSRRLWIVATMMALALHLGGAALALANLRRTPGVEAVSLSGLDREC